MFNTLFQQGLTLFLLAGLSFIATGTGWFFLRKTGATFSSFGEQAFFSAGTGLAIIGYSVFLLGIFQLFSPASFFILFIILAFLSLAGWLQLRTRTTTPAIQSLQHGFDKAAILIVIVSLAAGVLLVLTPETGTDAHRTPRFAFDGRRVSNGSAFFVHISNSNSHCQDFSKSFVCRWTQVSAHVIFS